MLKICDHATLFKLTLTLANSQHIRLFFRKRIFHAFAGYIHTYIRIFPKPCMYLATVRTHKNCTRSHTFFFNPISIFFGLFFLHEKEEKYFFSMLWSVVPCSIFSHNKLVFDPLKSFFGRILHYNCLITPMFARVFVVCYILKSSCFKNLRRSCTRRYLLETLLKKYFHLDRTFSRVKSMLPKSIMKFFICSILIWLFHPITIIITIIY